MWTNCSWWKLPETDPYDLMTTFSWHRPQAKIIPFFRPSNKNLKIVNSSLSVFFQGATFLNQQCEIVSFIYLQPKGLFSLLNRIFPFVMTSCHCPPFFPSSFLEQSFLWGRNQLSRLFLFRLHCLSFPSSWVDHSPDFTVPPGSCPQATCSFSTECRGERKHHRIAFPHTPTTERGSSACTYSP